MRHPFVLRVDKHGFSRLRTLLRDLELTHGEGRAPIEALKRLGVGLPLPPEQMEIHIEVVDEPSSTEPKLYPCPQKQNPA